MKFFKFNSNKEVNVNISKYAINWDHKVSGPQLKVKKFLFPFWKNHIVCEELRIPGCLLRIDLLNLTKRIIIEVSPRALHVDYNKFMHQDRMGYLEKLKSDAKKMDWAEKNNLHFIELYDEEIDNLSLKLFKTKFDIDIK